VAGIIPILLEVLFLHLSGETEKKHAECSSFLSLIEEVTSIVLHGDGTLFSEW
jgi:hypothetical protein